MDRQRSQAAHALRYYVVGRLTLGGAVALLLRPMGAPSEAPLFVLAALALTSLEGLRILRGKASVSVSTPGILLADFLIETYVILQTGAHRSPFLPLYGFTVLFGGLLLALRGGLVFGGLAALAASSFVWLVPMVPGGPKPETLLPEPAARFGLETLFFLALGGASGSLAALGRRRASEWEETSSRLEQTTLEAETILGNLPLGVLVLTADGGIRHMNPAARVLLGVKSPKGAPLGHLDDLDRSRAQPLLQLARRALSEDLGTRTYEIRLPNDANDQKPRPVEAVAAPIRGRMSDVRGVVLLFQDLTERKRLEAQARRQDRLAALGHFSAGLAHEIRNSLKPIAGSAELLASLDLPKEAVPLKDLLLREAEALEEFLEAYLDYARDKDLQIEPVEIDALIREELETLRCHPAWHDGIQMEQRSTLPANAKHHVDADQLRRALRNLLINALEATHSGVIRVVLSERAFRGVRIRIRDRGCGMDPKTLDNLYTPLFTTKARGTGLGLCYARRVVERHGGTLSVISRPGKGTLVTVDLPPAHIRAKAA